jgi:sugar/nucleoside kinase (ribokinase family)
LGQKTASTLGDNHCQNEVIVIGDVLMDHQYWVENMPQTGDDEKIIMSSKSSGGSAANTAIALSSLNIACGFCGRIGMDEAGQHIISQMKSVGLDITCIQYGESTGYTLTIIDKNSERTMFSSRGASDEPLELTPKLRNFLNHAKILFLSGYCLVNEKQAEFSLEAAKVIKRAGGMVALDASPNIGLVKEHILCEMFALTNIILPNKSELQTITKTCDIEQGIDILLDKIPCIALKLGSEGSMLALNKGFKFLNGELLTEKKTFFVPAIKTNPIDTTGAGDSFNAGFMASFLKGECPEDWLKTGNALAARVITEKGATSVFLKNYF